MTKQKNNKTVESEIQYIEFDEKDKKKLGLEDVVSESPSRIKTFLSCSWLYFCKYILKIPDASNDGAKRGTICHNLLECLLNKRHRKYLDIVENSGISHPVIERFVKKQMKKVNLGMISPKFEDNYKMIEEMVIVGIKSDFLMTAVTKGENYEIHGEKKFNFAAFKDGKPLFVVKGIIDKYVEIGGDISIADYKTSSQKFKKKELEKDWQSLIYSLFFKRLRDKNPSFNFIFLRFPKSSTVHNSVTEEQIKKCEKELEEISIKMSNFSAENAFENFAADKGFLSNDEGFGGLSMCGRSKYPEQKKEDGSPVYACSLKWPMLYYAEKDQNGKIVRSSLEKIEKSKEGNRVVKMKYNGCPKFNKK